MTKRTIRVLAIRTSDNDGSHACLASASGVQSRLETANQVYADAKIEFAFDSANDYLSISNTLFNRDVTVFDDPTDYTSKSSPPPSNSTMHDEARIQFAKLFKGRRCVFFQIPQ